MIFMGCVLFKSAPLDAATIFMVLTMLGRMKEPAGMFPAALSALIQVKVSTDRLNAFLLDDELNERRTRLEGQYSNIGIRIENGTFSWDPESDILVAKDLNVDLKKGQKLAVCGPVGAGKS